MSKEKFIELRKFSGKTLDDVLKYLKVDLSKSLHDAFSLLAQKRKDQRIYAIQKSGDLTASATNFNFAQLTLPKGKFHLTAALAYDGTGSGDEFTLSRAWLTRTLLTSAIPGDAVAGYNLAVIDPATRTDSGGDLVDHGYDQLTLHAHWYLDLKETAVVYLQGRATFSGGGATDPTYSASMVANGYVME